MSLIRGSYSISDLLEMDAKGKKSILPYICLVESEEYDDYLKSCKYQFLYENNRIADFFIWMKNKRKTTYVLYDLFLDRFQEDLCSPDDCMDATFTALIYYYMINIEDSINRKIQLRSTEVGIVSLLQAKAGNIKGIISKNVLSLMPDEYLTKMTNKLLAKYEYEEILHSIKEVPDSFYSIECVLHEYILIKSFELQSDVYVSALDDEREAKESLQRENSNLKSKLKRLEEKQNSLEDKKLQQKNVAKDYENKIALLEEEILSMQGKLTALEDRNRILSLTMTKEDVALNEELIEEENEVIDLSRYNIVLCGNDRHLKKYSYKVLDYYSGPQRITMLDKADIIAIITTDIEHAAYWAIKSYCRSHGLKFCNINGNTPRIVESGLKNFVRENLL